MIITPGMIVKINEAATLNAGKVGRVITTSNSNCSIQLENGQQIWVAHSDLVSELVKEVITHNNRGLILG